MKKLKVSDLKDLIKKSLIIILLNQAIIKNKNKYIGRYVTLNKINSKTVSVTNIGLNETSSNYKIFLKKFIKA